MAKKDIITKIHKDLKYSNEKVSKLHKAIKDDFSFAQGNQWEDGDVQDLAKAGVKAITINKIKPIVKLLTGIERQSRSDFKAFPEGGEDELTAEIVSRLMKNVAKNSRVEVKFSEVFKNGSIGGMCFLEPYMDYNFDLLNGDLKFKKISSADVYLDPDFQEYDLSDSKFLIKITKDLSQDDLLALFPDDEKKVKKIQGGKLDITTLDSLTTLVETDDYPETLSGDPNPETFEAVYDLVDYYYKELKTKYYTIIQEKGIIKEFDTQAEAESLAEQTGGIVISRKVPVIMLAQVVGNTLFYDDVAPFYPKWKTYPIIPFFAELITEDMKDFSLKIQGIVRGIKDLNEEYNKRRTQELRHLNSSANSGFVIEEGMLSSNEEAKLKKFGSSAGIVVKTKRGRGTELGRITPMPLSQGHAQLAAENAQDLKEASGVNPDLLANDSQSQSGRAILFVA